MQIDPNVPNGEATTIHVSHIRIPPIDPIIPHHPSLHPPALAQSPINALPRRTHHEMLPLQHQHIPMIPWHRFGSLANRPCSHVQRRSKRRKYSTACRCGRRPPSPRPPRRGRPGTVSAHQGDAGGVVGRRPPVRSPGRRRTSRLGGGDG
jgi:hypothetical protein